VLCAWREVAFEQKERRGASGFWRYGDDKTALEFSAFGVGKSVPFDFSNNTRFSYSLLPAAGRRGWGRGAGTRGRHPGQFDPLALPIGPVAGASRMSRAESRAAVKIDRQVGDAWAKTGGRRLTPCVGRRKMLYV